MSLKKLKKFTTLAYFVFFILFICSFFLNNPFSIQKAFANTTPDVFGEIKEPAGVKEYNNLPGVQNKLGIIVFISRLIRLSTIIAGIWVMINFIMAGWIYITSSGDTAAHGKVSNKIIMSVIGIVIIVTAYSIAGLIGLIVFGKADYILNPKLQGI